MSGVTRHVVVVADSRYPIGEPFAGGMQSLTWHLVRGLRARGVEVTLFAAPGSDRRLGARELGVQQLTLSGAARRDVAMQPVEWLEQHHAYLQLMLALSRRHDVDVVHNNSLHHLPVAMAEALPMPLLTTLHTPPTPWLEPAVGIGRHARHRLVAVSEHTAQSWAHVVSPAPAVVPNGVDLSSWPVGPGGDGLVWSGRIAPEKAPHLAIDIAVAAGRRLRLAGPVCDPVYWRTHVEPRLSGLVEYVGHLHQRDLARLVGESAACLVTPAWDEPYGLVVAEALACGTPVLAVARGGVAEVVSSSCARLVAPDALDTAAALVPVVESLERKAARRHAERHCSIENMLAAYLRHYDELAGREAA